MSNDAAVREDLLQNCGELKRRRVEAGLSQTALADRAACNKAHVSRLEAGNRSATPQMLARLAKVLRCKVADLLAENGTNGNGPERAT